MAFKKKFNGVVDSTVTLGKEGSPKSIEGYFLGTKTTESDYGPGKLHVFQTKEGTTGIWGKTRLDSQLTDDLKGQMVRVTFTGMIAATKKGRRPSYGFLVEHDPENTMEVQSLNLNVSSDEEDESEEDSSNDLGYDPEVLHSDNASVTKFKPQQVNAERQAKIQAMLNSKK